MATPSKYTQATINAALKLFTAKKIGSRQIARKLKIPRSTVESWLEECRKGRTVEGGDTTQAHKRGLMPEKPLQERVLALLRVKGRTIEELVTHARATAAQVRGALVALEKGYSIFHELSTGMYRLLKQPAPVEPSARHTILASPEGYFRIGIISDTHYGSKHFRPDVVQDLYRWFAGEAVQVVLHAGNWIDGEARFNKFDLLPEAHGMDAQIRIMVEQYPRIEGVNTLYVAGDDHEGWYNQREGVDIGKYLEMRANDAGRTDLQYVGYMEAFINLLWKQKKVSSQLLLVHPGGGSAYATSYAPQKFIESLQGGEKPAVAIFGHWHKIFDLLIRNVICLGAGCTKDLDTFGRKMKLAYHVGGTILELWMDEKGGTTRDRTEKRQYFDRGYHNNQWSLSGPVYTRGGK